MHALVTTNLMPPNLRQLPGWDHYYSGLIVEFFLLCSICVGLIHLTAGSAVNFLNYQPVVSSMQNAMPYGEPDIFHFHTSTLPFNNCRFVTLQIFFPIILFFLL
jgi:hypothetical protein